MLYLVILINFSRHYDINAKFLNHFTEYLTLSLLTFYNPNRFWEFYQFNSGLSVVEKLSVVVLIFYFIHSTAA